MEKDNENLKEEIQEPIEENDSLLKTKSKKVKKELTEGQKKALNAMNDARTKKKEEKLKQQYLKIMEKEKSIVEAPIPSVKKEVKKKMKPIVEDVESESSDEEIIIKKKKKKKKVIVIEESDESEDEEEEEVNYKPKSREMKTQQNRRSLIQQHNQKQTEKNFFCN